MKMTKRKTMRVLSWLSIIGMISFLVGTLIILIYARSCSRTSTRWDSVAFWWAIGSVALWQVSFCAAMMMAPRDVAARIVTGGEYQPPPTEPGGRV